MVFTATIRELGNLRLVFLALYLFCEFGRISSADATRSRRCCRRFQYGLRSGAGVP